MVWIWDGKDEKTKRKCNTVDVAGWASAGYVLCKEEYEALPADAQAYLATQVTNGKAKKG